MQADKLDKAGVPTSANMCHANSLTRSTSVVIRVMIWALLEKSPSSSSAAFPGCSAVSAAATVVSWVGMRAAAWGTLVVSDSDFGAAEEAMSFRTSVFAKSTELSWTRRRTWMVVVDSDHS